MAVSRPCISLPMYFFGSYPIWPKHLYTLTKPFYVCHTFSRELLLARDTVCDVKSIFISAVSGPQNCVDSLIRYDSYTAISTYLIFKVQLSTLNDAVAQINNGFAACLSILLHPLGCIVPCHPALRKITALDICYCLRLQNRVLWCVMLILRFDIAR